MTFVIEMSTFELNMITRISKIEAGGLFGRTRGAILGLLLLKPDEQFHLRQIARYCGTGLARFKGNCRL